MELVDFNAPKRFAETFNHCEFSERLYFCLQSNGIDIPYGIWHSKFLKNGMTKMVKALGIYKVEGARETKRVKIHPMLKLIIDTTCGTNESISKSVIDLVDGKYVGINKFDCVDLETFYKLPDNDVFNSLQGYGTYIIENKDTGLYKIGRTKNIVKRLYDLKKEHGSNLFLVAFKDEDIESLLHEKLKFYRFFGEWFNCDINLILDIINEHKFNFKKI